MRKISFRLTSRRSSHAQPGADLPTGHLAQAPSRGVSPRACPGGKGFRHPQVVHRQPSGAFVKATKPYVLLPAGVRHRCGVRSGDQVLVVADSAQDVLVVHPLAALDSMITAYHATLVDGGASA
jgi:hypothetical protein